MNHQQHLTYLIPRLKKYLVNFLDYIFPQFCLSCKKEGIIFCTDCLHKLQLLPIDKKPWPEENFVFDECHICLDYHDTVVKKLIKKYKYSYFENLAEPMADIYIKKIQQLDLAPDFIICNIPLHKSKKKKRGFDQTELIAKKICLGRQVPYFNLLQRQRSTKTQAQLNKEQRQKNMAQAFEINKKIDYKSLTKKPIVLIDDIATTGTTLNEAAQVLKRAGFSHIICLALAKN
ncbi:MAG: competence protein ComFC [Patescibacteria group bacterium]|nr:competence protein ComFC [Patescibacteria group bacterium]